MAATIPDMTRAGRDHRQAAWQAGADWCAARRLVRQALADCRHEEPHGQFLFLQGVANTLTAAGREIAGLDARKEQRP